MTTLLPNRIQLAILLGSFGYLRKFVPITFSLDTLDVAALGGVAVPPVGSRFKMIQHTSAKTPRILFCRFPPNSCQSSEKMLT